MQSIFEFTEEELILEEIFSPTVIPRLKGLMEGGGRFVHYTSAEVAISIIRNREVWMRNATTMNDFSEVEHGLQCMIQAWNSENGQRLRTELDKLHDGLADEIARHFDGWIPDMRAATYLTCLSEHRFTENTHGRLSMWRAYGGHTGIALVMNLQPFTVATDELKAYSSPVNYSDAAGVEEQIGQTADMFVRHHGFLKKFARNHIHDLMFTMLRFGALCTKHPAFSEELEWRVIYSPNVATSPIIQSAVELVRGVPQIVHKIPLKNSPGHGLVGADVPTLLDRIIIGPTEDTRVIYDALVSVLIEADVPNAHERVFASGIPLRH